MRKVSKLCKWVQIVSMLFTAVLFGMCLVFSLYRVGSGSMSPTYNEGDILILNTLVQPEKLQVGDVAGYVSQNGLTVVHRTDHAYLDPETDRVAWRMKGDAAEGLDVEVLTAANMKGRLAWSIKAADFGVAKTIGSMIFVIPIVLSFVAGLVKVYADAKVSDTVEQLAVKSTT